MVGSDLGDGWGEVGGGCTFDAARLLQLCGFQNDLAATIEETTGREWIILRYVSAILHMVLMMAESYLPYMLPRMSNTQSLKRAEDFFAQMDSRRSVRFFSDATVPRKMIELAIRTASTAPSGAHIQPWNFVVVGDPAVKRQIRIAAEKEEYASYEGGRMPNEWRQVLAPIGTTWKKPFLETVPWIVVVFEERYRLNAQGNHRKNYYVKESVGIACGMFITALHNMGLATLTHTPSPMAFLSDILQRPDNERPFILFPVGYPAHDATVPDLKRKSLDDISVWFESKSHL